MTDHLYSTNSMNKHGCIMTNNNLSRLFAENIHIHITGKVSSQLFKLNAHTHTRPNVLAHVIVIHYCNCSVITLNMLRKLSKFLF